MKANEAPEKIYLLSTPYHMLGGWYRDKSPLPSSFEQVEYTRTDAFIEKAQKWLKENVSKYLYNTGDRDEYIPTCSGKLFEDFNNAMKEE